METFDFDRQLRLMELAGSDAEVEQLAQAMHDYLTSDPQRKDERIAAWKQALARQRDRSAIELATFRELMGLPISA